MNTIGEIITAYRKKKHLSQQELAELLKTYGISTTNKTISCWEKNAYEPPAGTFLNLCGILGITDAYSEYFGSNPDNPLSGLNEEGKEKALDYISLLIDSGKYQPAVTTVLPIHRRVRLYSVPVSAGRGNFLENEEYSEIEAGSEVPEAADYGVRISGDSMEPQFTNGQLIWVQQQAQIASGEIGIFLLDGEAYCKKFQTGKGGTSLISLNQKYAPITVDGKHDFKVLGKVVG